MSEPSDGSCPLKTKHCTPCEGDTPPLNRAIIDQLLAELNGWECRDSRISKRYTFKNYLRVMAFVNATAWISLRENHHPDLEVGYDSCRVSYTTHAIGGLSENDFICAAKIDRLFEL